MGDFVRLVIDIVQLLWPFRLVHQWERAGFYVAGMYWIDVGPGVYPVIPWFMDVKPVSVVWHPIVSGRQDVTMIDGTTLTFDAMARARVIDVRSALNDTDDYHHSAINDLSAILAEKLATEDPDRLRPRRRGTLFAELTAAVAKDVALYGVEIADVRFLSFVLKVRTYRLLNDQAQAASW